MSFSSQVSDRVRELVSAHAFDAHLDYPGQGGWGSEEQLVDADKLRGALRVFFCEVDGKAPSTLDEHLHELERLDPLLTANAPGRLDPRHIEGCESVRSEESVYRFLQRAKECGVISVGPIYHKGNALGGCSKESGEGLTQLGKHFLSIAMKRRFFIDFAHMSEASIRASVEAAYYYNWYGRLAYTHGGIWHEGVTHPLIANGNQERCLSLETAKDVVHAGGMVCLSPCKPFYDEPEIFFEHIIEFGQLNFFERVGVGTDYGGILDEWRWPGCETVFDLFCFVTHKLLERGVSEQQVAGIIGDNFRRHLGLL